MNEQALILGLSTIVFLLVYLGSRFGRESEKGLDANGQKIVSVMPRLAEAISYCFAGIVGTVILFVLSESFTTATYGGVIRTLFLVFQIILGLLSSLGAIAFSIILVVLGVGGALKGLKK